MRANLQDTLHLLAWNGYGQQAYRASMACKETWTDERILFPKVINMPFGKEGKTLIGIYAQKACWYPEKEKRLIERVKYLLKLGADPDIADVNGVTPLTTTCFEYNSGNDIFNLLLSQNVRVNGDPGHSWNPLSLVATHVGAKKTLALLKKGADPNYKCGDSSILHLATSHHDSKGENTENIKLLLNAGANPNVLDSCNWSPTDYCIEKGYISYAKLLLDHGAVITRGEFLMESAIIKLTEPAIKFLHENGVAINRDQWEESLTRGNVPKVAMLLRCGACPNSLVFRRTPLAWAFHLRGYDPASLAIAKLLCKAGLDVNGKMYGQSILCFLFNDYINDQSPCLLQIIEMVVSKGGKVPSKAEYDTMLDIAGRERGNFIELNRIIMKGRLKK